ncbi:unnamed protein product [Anisakis simplex]|uniref:Reverse transcriptase n=1 Tax=Anisakis simplex TaxID=6269 RepID=A0A0M3IYR7_ANISI|nr:unnamed protein product [Anisakis simplex]
MARQLRVLLAQNSTLAARAILNETHIHARLASTILEVRPCLPVTNFSFISKSAIDNDTCYEFPPIEVRVSYHSIQGFLDPTTMIVSQFSKTISCSLSRYVPVQILGNLYQVDQLIGTTTMIPKSQISSISNSAFSLLQSLQALPNIPTTIFHHMLISNLTESFPSVHLAAAAHYMSIQQTINEHMSRITMHGEEPSAAQGSIFEQLRVFTMFELLWNVWISTVSFIITIKLISKAFVRLIVPNLLKTWQVLRREQREQNDSAGTNIDIVIQTAGAATELRSSTPQDKRSKQNFWPPRISIPNSISDVATLGNTFSAQICRKLNQIYCSFLIDTGSALTLTSSDWIDTLGVSMTPDVSDAIGVSGHTLNIKGFAKVNFTIANITTQGNLYFTDNSYIRKTSYDVIIGCDIMRHFPPFAIDINNGLLTIGGTRLRLGDPRIVKLTNSSVRLSSNTTIPPNTEMFVNCIIDGNVSQRTDGFLIETIDPRLYDLAITPGIIRPISGDVRILISNPSNHPINLYKNTRITSASEIIETGARDLSYSAITSDPNPKDIIVRALLGMGDPVALIEDDSSLITTTLNTSQQRVLRCLNGNTTILFQQAPAGTGKTFFIAAYVKERLQTLPTSGAMLVTATTNAAVANLADAILTIQPDLSRHTLLFMQSLTAEKRHADGPATRDQYRLPEILDDAVQQNLITNPTDLHFARRYIARRLSHDGRPDREDRALKLVLSIGQYKIFVMTIAMAENLHRVLWPFITHCIIDEAGLVPDAQLYGLMPSNCQPTRPTSLTISFHMASWVRFKR